MKFCSQCGVARGPSDKFCGSCGTPFGSESVGVGLAENLDVHQETEQTEAETEGNGGSSDPPHSSLDGDQRAFDLPGSADKKRRVLRNSLLTVLGLAVGAGIVAAIITQNSSDGSTMEIVNGCWGCTPGQLETIEENRTNDQEGNYSGICGSVERLEELWYVSGDVEALWSEQNRLATRIGTSGLDRDDRLRVLAKALFDTMETIEFYTTRGANTPEESDALISALDTVDSAFSVTLRECE